MTELLSLAMVCVTIIIGTGLIVSNTKTRYLLFIRYIAIGIVKLTSEVNDPDIQKKLKDLLVDIDIFQRNIMK